MSDQLQQARKLEAIGRLAGGVAHDFNNLLTVIQARASLVRDGLPERQPTRPELEEIVSAAERGSTLTQQLLAFSRKQVLQPEPANLNRVIDETADVLRRLIGETIALETGLESDLGWIEADPAQGLQVLLNLAANARDAMPEGGRLRISTGNAELSEEEAARVPAAAPGPYVVLTVRDTGRGCRGWTDGDSPSGSGSAARRSGCCSCPGIRNPRTGPTPSTLPTASSRNRALPTS
jgi:signal transduction histidine kinase